MHISIGVWCRLKILSGGALSITSVFLHTCYVLSRGFALKANLESDRSKIYIEFRLSFTFGTQYMDRTKNSEYPKRFFLSTVRAKKKFLLKSFFARESRVHLHTDFRFARTLNWS